MRLAKRLLLGLFTLTVVLLLFMYAAGKGLFGQSQAVGTVSREPIPLEVVETRLTAQRNAAPRRSETQILFGDFHTHTTFSADAYTMNMALLDGSGWWQSSACSGSFC